MPKPTYIHEYPHPRLVVHYHPVSREQLTLAHIDFALARQVHEVELDLHYRESDGQIVANHDSATEVSPTLDQVIRLVLEKQQGAATVHHDGLQFFLVLEPKAHEQRLFAGIIHVLERYTAAFSTAVHLGDEARGITVVITGDFPREFYADFPHERINRLFIAEFVDYGDEIYNLAAHQTPFQWVSLRHDEERGRVNLLHRGADRVYAGIYNIRVWDCQAADRSLCLASGVDAMNIDRDEIDSFQAMIAHHEACGYRPSLALCHTPDGTDALLTWRGDLDNRLYMALGTAQDDGLYFSRQIALTYFLEQEPPAFAPAAAFTGDGRILIVYEDAAEKCLWTICGRFANVGGNLGGDLGVRAGHFLTFDGKPRPLALAAGKRLCGSNPTVAVAPDGRIVIVYEGIDRQSLWCFSGFADAKGELTGAQHRLTVGERLRGLQPTLAINEQNQLFLAYRALESGQLHYFVGALDAHTGRIRGHDFPLGGGDAGRGSTPAVAFCGVRVLLVYQAADGSGLCALVGAPAAGGSLQGQAFALHAVGARPGAFATAALDKAGNAFVLYEAAPDQKFCYLHGALDTFVTGAGQARVLDMAG